MILAIYGAHGLAKEIYVVAKKINALEKKWDDFVFIDDINDDESVQGKRIYKFDDLLKAYSPDDLELIVGVGEPSVREKMFDKAVKNDMRIASVIHPGVYIDESVRLGRGVVISEGVTITCDVKIGDNSYIQPHAVIGHDIVIGKHSIIGSNSQIGGANIIGDRVFMGFLSGTRDHITIGNDTIISAGAVVFKDLPDSVVAIGNPARIMKKKRGRKSI